MDYLAEGSAEGYKYRAESDPAGGVHRNLDRQKQQHVYDIPYILGKLFFGYISAKTKRFVFAVGSWISRNVLLIPIPEILRLLG